MDTVNTAPCVIGLLQLFLLVLDFSENSVATDSITRSRGISVGQTLSSSGKTFELGFFTPVDSTRLYVGIRYKNISAQKVVWVANRDNPLSVNDTAANLTIGEDGNLILLDGMKSTLWSTNISSQPNRTFAVLSDKGDLTLYNSESRSTLWQSFSYPGDSFITGESKYNKKLIIAITTSCGVILFFFVLFFFLLKAKRKENRRRIFKEFGSGSSGLPMIEFDKLASACSNFSEVNKLGSGGFGPVYKGKLDDGIEIAVKRLSSHSGQGAVEFKNEILLVSKLQHRNLVKLLGYCIKKDEKLLIYEYLKNKSLDLFLFDKKSGLQLDWDRRFKIILGIARGLLYLHTDSRLRIIHRDLKAGNILLDDNMDPKISDFGLARAFHITEELANTNRVAGTFGYMSPEYAIEGRFSEKSDVFSFGILLLEIISGRKNTSRYCGDEYNLLGYAWHLWKEERGLELVDKALGSSYSTEQFMQCMHIGLLCTQDRTADRPTMTNTVLMLTSEMDLPKPKPPRFYQIFLGLDLRTNSNSRFTVNDVSLSLVEGR